MKRHLLMALVAILIVSCKGSREDHTVVSLLREFPFAQQQNLARGREAFKVAGNSIIQEQPGKLSFYLKLKRQPSLQFETSFARRSSADLEIQLGVRSEKTTRTFTLHEAGRYKIDLNGFADQLVEISFQAVSRTTSRLGGVLRYINPVLSQTARKNVAYRAPGLPEVSVQRPNVMIFLFDAANAAHLGCYGYKRNTTPNVDGLAKEGIVFENAMTQSASTLASTGSLFTGLYPEAHGVLVKPRVLDDRFTTLAEHLRNAGYSTAMFSGNPNASPVFGYGQGFDHQWVPRFGRPTNADDFYPEVEKWLGQTGDKPFFGYVHFREPHWPYAPPPEFLTRFHPDLNAEIPDFQNFGAPAPEVVEKVVAAYDANLAYADSQMGRILELMKEKGTYNNTIFIILADHGEGFWEHGKQGHNYPLYEEIIRIPLIFKLPRGSSMQPSRVKHPVGSIDVLPTILDLTGGQRKIPFLHGRNAFASGDRAILSQSIYKRMYALRHGDYKFIHHLHEKGTENELYNLKTDPAESRNILAENPVRAGYYFSLLSRKLGSMKEFRTSIRADQKETRIDEQTEQELKALGYVN